MIEDSVWRECRFEKGMFWGEVRVVVIVVVVMMVREVMVGSGWSEVVSGGVRKGEE